MPLPTHIGRYRVLELLGQGAMGVVYRARDEGLDREVAVKVIRGESLDDESRAQFLKEARAAARLQHPGIVTVYELGEEAGAPFLAMELLDGLDLQRAMRQGTLATPRRALAVIEQVLAALGHAHARGIVHRDLKPSNVFLHLGTHAKILDFGVARLGEGMTVTGRIVGTPHYMSPEQIRADRVDGRSDLFSTALMFYEVVTGAKAYRPGSAVTIMYQIVHEDADLSRLAPLPGGAPLEAALRRALARDREQRFPDAASLAAALAHAVHALPDVPMPPPPPLADTAISNVADEPLLEASSRPDVDLPYTVSAQPLPASPPAVRPVAAAAAVLISALVAGGAIWWWQARQEPLEKPLTGASIGPLPELPPAGRVPPTTTMPAPSPPDVSLAPSPAPEITSPAAAPQASLPSPAAMPPPSLPSPAPVTAGPSPRASPTPRSPNTTDAPSGDLQSRIDRAQALFESGRLRAALAETRAVLRADPGNTEAKYLADDIEADLAVEDHLRKARAALARGDRDAARREAEAGLRLKPNESRLTAVLRQLDRY